MAEKSKKTTSAGDVDVTSTVGTLKKWLKSLKVKTELCVSGKDIPPGLKHGILFLDYLRCQNFPQAVTASEQNILMVIADLCVKANQDGAGASSSGANQRSRRPIRAKAENDNPENNKEQLPKPKVEGPRKGVKKLGPLSEAMNKLNIQAEIKGCRCKADCGTKNCGCRKKDAHCTESCKCSQGCVNKTEKVQNGHAVETGRNGRTVETRKKLEPEEESSDEESGADTAGDSEEDIEGTYWMKENVDWNKHIASLVQCPKCERKFLPARVKYHAEVCINVCHKK